MLQVLKNKDVLEGKIRMQSQPGRTPVAKTGRGEWKSSLR